MPPSPAPGSWWSTGSRSRRCASPLATDRHLELVPPVVWASVVRSALSRTNVHSKAVWPVQSRHEFGSAGVTRYARRSHRRRAATAGKPTPQDGRMKPMTRDSRRRTPATFVLVHGASNGGWCWRRVSDLLTANGHRVFAPTLTGLCERSHLMNDETDLTTHINDVVNEIKWKDLDKV